MFDTDLAELYGVTVGHLNEAVKRNRERFPNDFMFQLTQKEFKYWRSQSAISSLKSQIAISKLGRGGRQTPPYVFTEQGVAMLSSILKSKIAVQVNITIMRAFVKLREVLSGHKDLAHKLEILERKYDKQFKVVFDVIRELMKPEPPPPQQQIGFRTNNSKNS
jgi:hypothetical protein